MGCLCESSWAVGLLANETQEAEWFGPDCSLREWRRRRTSPLCVLNSFLSFCLLRPLPLRKKPAHPGQRDGRDGLRLLKPQRNHR